MDVEARSGREPGPHFRMLVGRIVVHDEMGVEIGRDHGVDMLQEVQELLVAMTLSALCDHLTVGDIERSEQCGRSVPDVVVGDAFRVAQPERQDRLRPFQRLDLGLLVDAQHHGVVGGIQVQPDDVAHLVDEGWIGRELEGLRAVRLHTEKPEHPTDRALGKAGLGSSRANCPVCAFGRPLLQNGAQQPGDALFVVSSRPA